MPQGPNRGLTHEPYSFLCHQVPLDASLSFSPLLAFPYGPMVVLALLLLSLTVVLPSSQALDCLVRLASVRRSLFTGEAERLRFLSEMINGTREILRKQQGNTHTALPLTATSK